MCMMDSYVICLFVCEETPSARVENLTVQSSTRGASGLTHSRLSWHVSAALLDLQERKRRQGLTLGLQVGISRTSWNRPASQTRDLQDLLDSSLGEDKVTLLSPIPPAASAICKILMEPKFPYGPTRFCRRLKKEAAVLWRTRPPPAIKHMAVVYVQKRSHCTLQAAPRHAKEPGSLAPPQD